jgi:ribonucleoside-diphosphate reductase alpha chain
MNKIQNLKDFIFISRYSKQNGNTKETYSEAVTRVMSMHHDFTAENLLGGFSTAFEEMFSEVYDSYYKQEILGAQRSLQFGGESLLKHHMRMYNCTATYVDRVDFFHELMYVGLCGAGAGYTVAKDHIDKLPKVIGPIGKGKRVFKVPDSIEGWSLAAKEVTYAYFFGSDLPEFDYSGVREEGSFITGGFTAPGPAPLKKCIELMISYLDEAVGRKIRSFEAHLLACTIADAVISGGVRRAALLCMFDADDTEMRDCKTSDLAQKYPQLFRSNNSAIILPDTPYEVYKAVYDAGKLYGEPGFAFVKSIYHVFNPCFEVGMFPTLCPGDPTKTGWSVCNLTEINGSLIKTAEDFYRACIRAAYLGTMQATYTDFPFLGKTTEMIVRRDSLIGVGITGMANSPSVLFDPEVQKMGASLVKEANKKMASILGINPAARNTVVKPSGNSSQMLGTFSGIHAGHSPKYIRNVQGTRNEQSVQIYQEMNPLAVEPMAYKEDEGHVVLSFPVEYDYDVMVKDDLTAKDFMELVKLTQQNWIVEGTNWDHPVYSEFPEAAGLTHNVSNTITRSEKEEDLIEEYLWENKEHFCGVSFLGATGDLAYKQSPYIEVLDEVELSEVYGAAAILAGGFVVDGIHAFGDLYDACDTAIGLITQTNRMYTQNIEVNDEKISKAIVNGLDDDHEFKYQHRGVILTDVNAVIAVLKDEADLKMGWVMRFERFADRYMKGDLDKTAECLKRISATHTYQELLQSKPVYWEDVEWENNLVEAGSQMGTACAGGKCEI